MTLSLRTVAVGAVILASLASRPDAAPRTTLAVPGRANANVSLASLDSLVVAVWSASTPAGETDVYVARSRNGGRTFAEPVRVNSTPGDARVNGEQPPRIAIRTPNRSLPEVVVVWTTKGTAGTKLLQAVSSDGGRTFAPSTLVPGSDAAGNRGWEAVAAGPGGRRFFSVWLDHRKLAAPQQTQMAGEHHHDSGGAMPAPAAAAPPKDGVAMAQLSQLYVAALDGTIAPQGVTGGVCYCCKTAVVAGPGNMLALAWRHVYAGNMRDIAFTVSRDAGRSFGPIVRVSEDKWQLEGCPDDGPSMVIDKAGAAHIVWPAVVTEKSGLVKALFYATSRDGKSFTPRRRLPTEGQANHPQLAIDATGALAVTWDESGTGTRLLASAIGTPDATGAIQFTRRTGAREVGTYPVVAAVAGGGWLRAYTVGDPAKSEIRVDTLN